MQFPQFNSTIFCKIHFFLDYFYPQDHAAIEKTRSCVLHNIYTSINYWAVIPVPNINPDFETTESNLRSDYWLMKHFRIMWSVGNYRNSGRRTWRKVDSAEVLSVRIPRVHAELNKYTLETVQVVGYPCTGRAETTGLWQQRVYHQLNLKHTNFASTNRKTAFRYWDV